MEHRPVDTSPPSYRSLKHPKKFDAGMSVHVVPVIQSLPAYIATPRNSGRGSTGIYVDSMWSKKNSEQIPRVTRKLCLAGDNLSEKNHIKVLEAIKTLKFLSQLDHDD